MPDTQAQHAAILTVLVLMFAMGGMIAFLFHRLKLPTFLAFILTGVLMGPHVLNLVDAERVELLAQIGVIFLLFIVGLDLSIDKLKQMRYQAPLAGVLQLTFTTALLTLTLYWLLGWPLQLAFLLGSILSLSSTTIVLKSMEDNRENDTDYGRLILGILIIQDLSIVPLMTLLPALTQPFNQAVAWVLMGVIAKALLFALVAVVISLRIVPFFLDRLASINQKEVFTLALVVIGVGMALLTYEMGLSYEAGAFVAGLALSGSVFCRQIIADSKGFRDVFITMFFVSMGLLFNLDAIVQQPGLVIGTTVILIVLKAIAATLAAWLLRFPVRTAIWCGIALFQVGEFSFILLNRTLETVSQVPAWHSTLTFWSPVLIDAIILTMFITPLAIRYLPNWWLGASPSSHHGMVDGPGDEMLHMRERVVVAGYGPTAQNLVDALNEKGIPHTIIEVNLDTIKRLNKRGISAVFGDVSRREVLEGAGVQHARVLALTFPDVRTSEIAIQQAKQLNPNIICLVRSRYRADIKQLYQIGADVVIHEEFETSVSFIFNIMTQLEYPIVETERLIALVREKEQARFGEHFIPDQPVFGRFSLLEGTKIEWVELSPDSELVGQTLAESAIRQRTGVNVIAVIKSGEGGGQVAPEPNLRLLGRDVLVVVGGVEQLHALEALVSAASAD